MAKKKLPEDFIKHYDRGYISKEIKNIKVDDDRPKRWTTLDVEPTGGVSAEAVGKIRYYQDKIKAINNEITNYDADKLLKNKIEYRRLKLNKEAINSKLNKLYDGKKLKDYKETLSRALKDLSKLNKRKNKDPAMEQRLNALISATGKRIQAIKDAVNKRKFQETKIRNLDREIRHAERYTLTKLEESLARMENRIMEVLIEAKDNTHIPYYSGEISRAREEYSRLNLQFFESKEEMILFFNSHARNFWSNHSIEKYWKEYKHRDELIASGQYQEYVANKYRENYLKSLTNVDRKSDLFNVISANLKKLTADQLIDLFGARLGSVTKPGKYIMPTISLVYLIQGVHERGRVDEELSILKQVRDAFTSVGLEFDDTLYSPSEDIYKDIAKRRYKGAAKKQIEIEDLETVLQVEDILKSDLKRDQVNVYTNTMDKAANFAFNRFLSYSERAKYSPDEMDTYQKRRIIIKAINKLGVRINRFGKAYVPFFSSEIVAELLSDLEFKK